MLRKAGVLYGNVRRNRAQWRNVAQVRSTLVKMCGAQGACDLGGVMSAP